MKQRWGVPAAARVAAFALQALQVVRKAPPGDYLRKRCDSADLNVARKAKNRLDCLKI